MPWPKLTAAVALFAVSLTAPPYKPGPQVLTFFSDVDDSDQPYARRAAPRCSSRAALAGGSKASTNP
jgi:hypothetical protein